MNEIFFTITMAMFPGRTQEKKLQMGQKYIAIFLEPHSTAGVSAVHYGEREMVQLIRKTRQKTKHFRLIRRKPSENQ